MILRLFDYQLDIAFDSLAPTLIHIEDVQHCQRLVRSFISGMCHKAEQPYQFIENGESLTTIGQNITVVSDPYHAFKPTSAQLTKLYQQMYCLLKDEELHSKLEKLSLEINDLIFEGGTSLLGGYTFAKEWDLMNYFKSFKLEPSIPEDMYLIEAHIAWMSLLADIHHTEPIVFVNFGKNFTKNELELLCKKAKFLRIPLFFIESSSTAGALQYLDNLNCYRIDLDFCVW